MIDEIMLFYVFDYFWFMKRWIERVKVKEGLVVSWDYVFIDVLFVFYFVMFNFLYFEEFGCFFFGFVVLKIF